MDTLTSQRVSFPKHPRFVTELAAIEFRDGWIVDGTDRLRLIFGDLSKIAFERIAPLADGRRTSKMLESELSDIPSDVVRSTLSLLFANGLLEEGPGRETTPVCDLPSRRFFSRFTTITGLNGSGVAALRRLQAQHVFIFFDDRRADAELLETLLNRTGFDVVRVLPYDQLDTCMPDATITLNQLLCVSVSSSDNDSWHKKLDSWCAFHSLSWLRIVVNEAEDYADVGPLFIPTQTPCYRCFHHMHCQSLLSSCKARATSVNPAFWIGVAALEITYLVSRIVSSPASSGFKRYTISSCQSKTLSYFVVPGCNRCRPNVLGPPLHGVRFMEVAVAFEDCIKLWWREFSLRSPEDMRSRRQSFACAQTKYLPECRAQFLGEELAPSMGLALDALTRDNLACARQITRNDLAVLLRMTAGIRTRNDKTLKRWAPTAGNLGSVELYVSVQNVEGVARGEYLYQAADDSLADLQWRSPSLIPEEFIKRVLGRSGALPDVVVTFTAAFHRVSQKYGPFGYRLIHFDAGCAISQFKVVARSLGLHAYSELFWADDLLEEHFRLSPFDEQITAVVLLHREELTGLKLYSHSKQSAELCCPSRSSLMPIEKLGAFSLYEMTKALYSHSRITESTLTAGLSAIRLGANVEDPHFCRTSLTTLPPPAMGGQQLLEVLYRRATIRTFAPKSIASEQLATVLEFGAPEIGSALSSAAAPTTLNLSLYVIVLRVDGILPGVYAHERRQNALIRISSVDPSPKLTDIYIQRELESAPVHIWIVGNLDSISSEYGAWGYRSLLVSVGALAYRLWIAALSIGLDGAVIAGINRRSAERLLQIDGYGGAAFLAFTCGFQVTD